MYTISPNSHKFLGKHYYFSYFTDGGIEAEQEPLMCSRWESFSGLKTQSHISELQIFSPIIEHSCLSLDCLFALHFVD